MSLPIQPTLGDFYWRINIGLNATKPGWAARQKDKTIAELIPEIDAMVERGEIVKMKMKEGA